MISKNIIIVSVREVLEKLAEDVVVHDVSPGKNNTLHLVLSWTSEEPSVEEVQRSIVQVTSAYFGGIQRDWNAFDRAMIDFSSEDDEIDHRFELRNEWAKELSNGKMDTDELIAKVLGTYHVIDANGLPWSGEELEQFVEEADEE